MKSFCMEKAYKSFRKKGPKNKLKYPKRGKKPLSRPKVIRVGRVTRNKTFFFAHDDDEKCVSLPRK